MINWKKLYLIMVNGVEIALEEIEKQNIGNAKEKLIETLNLAEDFYINSKDS